MPFPNPPSPFSTDSKQKSQPSSHPSEHELIKIIVVTATAYVVLTVCLVLF